MGFWQLRRDGNFSRKCVDLTIRAKFLRNTSRILVRNRIFKNCAISANRKCLLFALNFKVKIILVIKLMFGIGWTKMKISGQMCIPKSELGTRALKHSLDTIITKHPKAH